MRHSSGIGAKYTHSLAYSVKESVLVMETTATSTQTLEINGQFTMDWTRTDSDTSTQVKTMELLHVADAAPHTIITATWMVDRANDVNIPFRATVSSTDYVVYVYMPCKLLLLAAG